MFTTYNLFKFIHVSSVIVWIGGVLSIGVFSVRLAREGPAMAGVIERATAFMGARVVGPSAGLALISRIVMLVVGKLGMPFWVWWGLGMIVLTSVFGGVFMRRAAIDLRTQLGAVSPSDGALAAARRRLAIANGTMVVLLLTAVWAMVFKPTF